MFFRLKLYQKMRLLQLIHFVGFLVSFFSMSWPWLAAGVASYIFFETFGGNIGLHRYFCHKSFQTSRAIELFLAFVSTLVGAGSTLSWVGAHRHHHYHADTPRDIHSPYFQTYFNIMWGNWDVRVSPRDVRDLLKDPVHRGLHTYYFKIHLVWAAILYAIHPMAFLFLYCWPCFLCLQSGYLLAIWAHKHGYKTYETNSEARNSWLVNLYTLGEGWHNNHHQHPERYRQGEKWWEFDFPAFIIENFLLRVPRTRPQFEE